jgi:AcrR family transcriptional regulator
MRFTSDPPRGPKPEGGRDSYHHGNLREALVDAALSLIAERGPAGFTFAEVARAAGVSAAAPYRHFRDRNALIAEIARQGYERFSVALEQAVQSAGNDPVRAVESCGRAYLSFARKQPAAYAAMFEPGFPLEEDAALLRASEAAFAVLRRAADAASQAWKGADGKGGGARPPPLMVALHIWALCHGTAALFVGRNDSMRRRLPMAPEELLEAGLLIYLQSLGLSAKG